jgi:diguanylate cyclase (GGDEF)-like protein
LSNHGLIKTEKTVIFLVGFMTNMKELVEMKRWSAVIFMNRLTYLQKFLLIGVILMLPFALTTYMLIKDMNMDIDSARKKKQGIEYNNGIRQLMEHLQSYRGLLTTYLNGDSTFKQPLLDEHSQIDEDITKLDQIDERLQSQLITTDKWKSIRDKWLVLKDNAFNLSARESFELHTSLISDLISFIIYIGDTSGLRLEPGSDCYYLMNTMFNKLPVIIETAAQARGLGSGIAAKKTLTVEEKQRLITLSGNMQSAMDAIKSRRSVVEGEYLQLLLRPYIQNIFVTTGRLLELLNNEIIHPDKITIQPKRYYDIATIAIDTGYSLYDAEGPELIRLIDEQIYTLSMKKLLVAGLALAVFLLVVYLYRAFYQSVIHTIYILKQASDRFADGDLSVRVELQTKDELKMVGNAFNNVVDAFAGMMLERQNYESKIEYQAYYDPLTGLPNRIMFNNQLKLAMEDAKRDDRLMAVMFLDLDRFKVINDTLGHEAGDLLLKAVAQRLTECLASGDRVYRMGGDEFLFIFSDMENKDHAKAAAQAILDHLKAPVYIDSHEFMVSASIGISVYPMDGMVIGKLVKNADVAMYAAKNHGKNNFQFYETHMNARAAEHLQIESSLRKALEYGEFMLYYQPRFNMISNRITGMEALIRWRHPELGLVPPIDFIPLAEESGFIVPLGEWVMRTACIQCREWQQQENLPLHISVNISAAQFQRDEFVELVKRILEESKLDPAYLELELTESVIMEKGDMAINKLNQLKALGVKISIDDFGTGFSSLSYLKYFPIDSLKIDRSFIKDIPGATKDSAITKTIIALGRRLNLNVVAEGVETQEQFSFLASRKCTEVQGYLISKPLPPEEAILLLRTNESEGAQPL